MEIQVAGRLKGTEEYYFSRKLAEIEQMNRTGAKIINLGIGSPDLPPAPEVIDILMQEASKSGNHAYQSYRGSPMLREAIAAWYLRHYDVQLDPEKEILPLMGSKEGIMHVCMTYLEEGTEALIPNPGYPTYASAVQLSGARAVSYKLSAVEGWLPDLDRLSGQVTDRTRLMWLNYPHMPTGAKASKSFFEELVAFANEHNILLCHDNPYSFILNDEPLSLLSVNGAKEVAIELNSLSKSSNMAGWRVGMLTGATDRIAEILRFKSNMDSGMFLPVQLAAAKALSLSSDWYDALNETYASRKKLAESILVRLGCDFEPDQSGLFVWARVPDRYDSGYALSDEVLQQARVFLTPGGIFGSAGNAYVRISLCANTDTFNSALERLHNNGGVE